MNIGFLASHNSSNMQAIIDACKSGTLQAVPAVIISNNSDSGAISLAKQEGIPVYHISSKTHPKPGELDEAILSVLLKHGVTIVVLAGYMKKLGPKTLSRYAGAVLNSHPALLPKYSGKGMYGIRVHEEVLAAGEDMTGVSIHVVDEEYGTGHVIAQAWVSIEDADTPESLQERVLEQEHILFSETLQNIANGEIQLSSNY